MTDAIIILSSIKPPPPIDNQDSPLTRVEVFLPSFNLQVLVSSTFPKHPTRIVANVFNRAEVVGCLDRLEEGALPTGGWDPFPEYHAS